MSARPSEVYSPYLISAFTVFDTLHSFPSENMGQRFLQFTNIHVLIALSAIESQIPKNREYNNAFRTYVNMAVDNQVILPEAKTIFKSRLQKGKIDTNEFTRDFIDLMNTVLRTVTEVWAEFKICKTPEAAQKLFSKAQQAPVSLEKGNAQIILPSFAEMVIDAASVVCELGSEDIDRSPLTIIHGTPVYALEKHFRKLVFSEQTQGLRSIFAQCMNNDELLSEVRLARKAAEEKPKAEPARIVEHPTTPEVVIKRSLPMTLAATNIVRPVENEIKQLAGIKDVSTLAEAARELMIRTIPATETDNRKNFAAGVFAAWAVRTCHNEGIATPGTLAVKLGGLFGARLKANAENGPLQTIPESGPGLILAAIEKGKPELAEAVLASFSAAVMASDDVAREIFLRNVDSKLGDIAAALKIGGRSPD